VALPDQIGRYRIVRQLGQGGMGVVYEARDDELDRALAIKTIAEPNADAVMRERFRREARAAAGIRHPNVCQVYEIGEHEKTLFIAMELLEGETLAARIQRGPLPAPDALTVALETLSALDALHSRDLVHRDLKPLNIFLGPHGIKLLDFGLAQPPSSSLVRAADETISPLTQVGLVVGTPQYMAPEQVQGRSVDGRTDLFSLGAILFEMLTGSRPFKGSSPMELYHAVLFEQPPAIGGFPAASVINRVVRRALAKRPDDRYPDAAAMAHALEAARARDDSGEALAPRAIMRLMILPFRVLRSDPDTDFLAFSIPDAVGNALVGLQSLVVRSAAAGARYAGDVLDLSRIAREAEVDVVLSGSLVRAGNRIRVTTQLIETPSGTLLWSHAPQVSLQDLFQLQDEVVQGIVDSLSLSLTARERRLLKHDVPASAKAYEFYLRANQAGQAAVALDPGSWAVARDLYLQCLEEDPDYAPAWARIGRIYRVTGKWGRAGSETNLAKAEAAFRRALDINPDLSIAHNLYAQLEVDLGRAEDAMLRLIERAKARGADPELFAGLVHACRFCGLLEASVAAHRQARRLDPGVATSVGQTYFMLGDYAQVLAEDINATPNVRNLALAMLGREAEAVANYRALEAKLQTRYGDLLQCGRALLEGRREESLTAAEAVLASELKDPETLFHLGRILARLGERQQATSLVGRAVEHGFFCYPAIARDPWLDSLRGDAGFVAVLREAETRHRGAQLTFARAGGDRGLGLTL
jgi:serine/threonine protein kinase/tetratricopeptide (TPR) repeat protein